MRLCDSRSDPCGNLGRTALLNRCQRPRGLVVRADRAPGGVGHGATASRVRSAAADCRRCHRPSELGGGGYPIGQDDHAPRPSTTRRAVYSTLRSGSHAEDGRDVRSGLDCLARSEARMKTAKEEVREILDQIPDNASLEEIQYHIYVRQKIERGLEDVKQGKTISQEE